MRRVPPVSLTSCVLALALVACSSGNENKPNTGTAGTGAGAAGSTGMTGSAGSTGTPGTAGSASGTAGAGTAGATAGASGTAGAGGTAGTSGTAGTGTAGGAGASNNDASVDHGSDGAPSTTAGCAGHNYQLCLDFESGIDTSVWGTRANANAIETTEVAHGTHAFHLYSDDKTAAQGGLLVTTKLGTLKDQIWGRFYVHFKPGAPGGHGNLIAASPADYVPGGTFTGNWYEIGWQFDGIMGVWHTVNPTNERPLRSKPYIVDQWYCVELLFDGTKTDMPRWWIDGAEAQYYTPNSTTNPATPAVVLVPQFKTITVGWTPYAGLGLMLPDQNKIIDTRQLNDAWIDDVAFDTQRIGCIQ